MSNKMNYIPFINSYENIRAEMNNDLQYRLRSRTAKTSLGLTALLSNQYSVNYNAGVSVLLSLHSRTCMRGGKFTISMMSKEEMQVFSKLFSKYCRQEINRGHCEPDCCDFCPVNSAYDEIFNRFTDDEEDSNDDDE